MAQDREGLSRESDQGGTSQIAWVVVSAIALVLLAPGFFVAGFFTNELVSDDGGETAVVAQPTPTATPATATPTPAPVAATVDDDPFTGPEDAAVTLIEFSDYE